MFVPALTGLGAPHWRPDARGMIIGITRGTHAGAHRRAPRSRRSRIEIHDVLERCGDPARSPLRVDGGASANDLLMQLQADLLGVEVGRPEDDRDDRRSARRSSPGSAPACGRRPTTCATPGSWTARFTPAADRTRADAAHARWIDAVERSKGWAAG